MKIEKSILFSLLLIAIGIGFIWGQVTTTSKYEKILQSQPPKK